MTGWEYKIVEINYTVDNTIGYERICNVYIDGELLDFSQEDKWQNSTTTEGGRRHEALNELGKEGWELIKTRSKFQNMLEVLYFKRPL